VVKRLRIISLISLILGTTLIMSASYFELFFPPKNAFYLGIFGDIILTAIRSVGVSLITSTFINLIKLLGGIYWKHWSSTILSTG